MKNTIFILALLICATYEMSFSFWLAKNSNRCFGDSYNKGTLVRGQIRTDNPNFIFSIYDGNGNKLYSKGDENVVVFTFTTKDSSIHQLCFDNRIDKEIKIAISIVFGITASDETLLLKKSDTRGMDFYLSHLRENIERMKATQMMILNNDMEKIRKADGISQKLWIGSVMSIFLLLVLFIVQRKYIVNFFRKKKVI